MNLLRRPLVWIVALPLLGIAAYVAFGVFGVQKAFINDEVNEDFPVAQGAAASTSLPAVPTAAPVQPTVAPTIATHSEAAAPTVAPALTSVPEPTSVPTPDAPVLVTSGQFHAVEHDGSGDVLVYQQPDGSYVLRLENLNVENGPDLYVYAVAATDAIDEQGVIDAGFINVAQLKGNVGNQTYELPADFDPAVHRAISIWCQRFTVNFATAPLQ